MGQVPGRFWGRFQEGSGAGSGKVPGQVPGRFEPRVSGRFRGRFRTTGSGKVPGQFFERRVPGSGNRGFREGSGAGSERQVPGRFRVSFSNDGFQVPGTAGSGKVPGQVLNDRFREGSGSVLVFEGI